MSDDRSKALVTIAKTIAELGGTDSQVFTAIYFADRIYEKYKGRTDRFQQLNSIVKKVRHNQELKGLKYHE